MVQYIGNNKYDITRQQDGQKYIFSVDTGKAQDKTQHFFMTKTEQDRYRKTIT